MGHIDMASASDPRPASDETGTFALLVSRLKAGDPEAAVEIVKQYEQEVRRYVRARLVDPRLKSLFDSVDICQSVLGNFFVRASCGQFDLESPQDLLALLLKIAQNHLAELQRRQLKLSPPESLPETLGDSSSEMRVPIDPQPQPAQVAASRDLLQAFLQKLSPEERQISIWRTSGLSWQEIASKLGRHADAVRKQLARACNVAAAELGIGEPMELD